MNTKRMMRWMCFFLFAGFALVVVNPVCGDLVDLVYEFDGDSDGMTSFGTVELTQVGSSVDFEIIANTANLAGGDIHELYFNLPDMIDISFMMISDVGGISDQTIGSFSSLGANPSVAGGADASFDAGISFGNGGGPPGNGTLTTATFSLTAMGGLTVGDILSQTSTSDNAPPVFLAVHFQSADVFGNGSETVGGGIAIPEPGSTALLLVGLMLLRNRRRS